MRNLQTYSLEPISLTVIHLHGRIYPIIRQMTESISNTFTKREEPRAYGTSAGSKGIETHTSEIPPNKALKIYEIVISLEHKFVI